MRHVLVLLAVGCGGVKYNGNGDDAPSVTPTTQVAVENAGAADVSVTLSSSAGDVTFPEVAAGTTTDYEDVDDWDDLDLTITIDVGSVQGGTLTLDEDYLNVVILSDDAAPDLKTYEIDVDPGAGAPDW